MSDWRENDKGNFVYFDDGIVTTVFLSIDGEWIGIRDGLITERGFKTPDAAMEAIDSEKVKFFVKTRPTDTGWLPAKKGGFYRQCSGGIATVKQASSGKWYVTVNGKMIQSHWLCTKEEAVKLADHYLC
jgi:hypothetical protein